MGTLAIEPFRSRKWSNSKSDTKNETMHNRLVLFPSEQASGKRVNGTIASPCELGLSYLTFECMIVLYVGHPQNVNGTNKD